MLSIVVPSVYSWQWLPSGDVEFVSMCMCACVLKGFRLTCGATGAFRERRLLFYGWNGVFRKNWRHGNMGYPTWSASSFGRHVQRVAQAGLRRGCCFLVFGEGLVRTLLRLVEFRCVVASRISSTRREGPHDGFSGEVPVPRVQGAPLG